MRRSLFSAAVAAASIFAAVLPPSADAQVLELGDQTATPLVAPTCPAGVNPSQCTIVLTRVTALATFTDGTYLPTMVTKAGRIVAFTVGLSSLSSSTTTRKKDIDYLNANYGGDAQVQMTILREVKHKNKKKRKKHEFRVVAESGIFHVVQYLGSVAQLPLQKSVEVKPGDLVALTTPTWAPVLAIDLSGNFHYRQSRNHHCDTPPTVQKAQATGGDTTYDCTYGGTRPEYAATEVTYPVASNPVH
ncbi:MAG TPA: hypothetical protein VE983_08180 [Solirubrobacteraceae bacterium]|nr:hypothetical protein [Solirubrobacteraceae bacterium]